MPNSSSPSPPAAHPPGSGGEALVDADVKIVQSNLIRIGREADAAIMVNTIIMAMDVKSIQMLIAPAEGNLQGVMQFGDRAVATHKRTGVISSD